MIFYETLEYGSTYLLPCYCIRRSLEFDVQHYHIPKKLNFVPQLYPLCSPVVQEMSSKDISYLELWRSLCSVEMNHLCNISGGYHEE